MAMYRLKVQGIKCDSDGCNYRKEDVYKEDIKNYVNKACPKCGAPLLTEKDAFTLKVLMGIEKIFDYTGINWLHDFFRGKETKYHCKMDGSGNVTATKIEKCVDCSEAKKTLRD